MKEFIPITDDYLEQHPEILLQLVPLQLDRPCRHLLVPVERESGHSPTISTQLAQGYRHD
ncbi:MAG: hypothetical protein V7711_06035 [Pseudomonadales bacterium]